MNEHLSSDVFKWRVIHSLCAVVRVVEQLRAAVGVVSEGRAFDGEDPLDVDGLDSIQDHVVALREVLSVVEKTVPVLRMRKRAPGLSPSVSRDTYPAPFDDVGDDPDAS